MRLITSGLIRYKFKLLSKNEGNCIKTSTRISVTKSEGQSDLKHIIEITVRNRDAIDSKVDDKSMISILP